MFLLLKNFLLLILYKKSSFSDNIFRRWTWSQPSFVYLGCLRCSPQWEIILKYKTFRWMNIFAIVMYTYRYVFRKSLTLRDHSFKELVWHLLNFINLRSLHRVLGKSCFKTSKVLFDEYIYHWNIKFH